MSAVTGAAAPAEPCVPLRPAGLRKPTSRRVDPDLDPELVGQPHPEPPEGLPPEWTEAGLAQVFDHPGDTLDCSEWPCLVEIRRPGGDPNLSGDAVTFEDLEARLGAAGLTASLTGGVQQVGDDEVMIVAVTPEGFPHTPAMALRTDVRLFWAEEAVSP